MLTDWDMPKLAYLGKEGWDDHGEYSNLRAPPLRNECGNVVITDANVAEYQGCTEIGSLTVRARPCPRARLIAPVQPRASRRASPAAELMARGHACVRLRTQRCPSWISPSSQPSPTFLTCARALIAPALG